MAEGEDEEEEVAPQLSERSKASARGSQASPRGARSKEDCPHDKPLTFQGMLGKEGLAQNQKKGTN